MKRILLIIIGSILLAFTTSDTKSEYTLQPAAFSVYADDIDLDGDVDIITGHNFNEQSGWTGISELFNDDGYFTVENFYFNGQHRSIISDLIDLNGNKDLITQYYENSISKIAIIHDFVINQNTIQAITLNGYADYIKTGNIDGENNTDIVFANNNDQFWGILYNDGTGNFPEPEYHYVYDYYPTDIDCGDLNGDGREDVVICGQKTEVYFSYPGNFLKTTLETDDFKDGIVLSDFDFDNDLDIVTFVNLYIIDYTRIKIYENIGNNNFDTLDVFDFQPACSIMFLSDFNNDSLPDIVFHTYDQTGANVFYNEDNFLLSDPQFIEIPDYGEYSRTSYCADIDGNGFNDIITLRYLYAPLSNNLSILFNDGNGNFVEDPITEIQNSKSKTQNSIRCYPNPFTTETTIETNIKENEFAELFVYNLSGEKVKTLTNKTKEGGITKIKWDGLDTGDNPCKPGPYLLTLKVNGIVLQTIKLIKY